MTNKEQGLDGGDYSLTNQQFRELRDAFGLNSPQMADVLGSSANAVNRWAGEGKPTDIRKPNKQACLLMWYFCEVALPPNWPRAYGAPAGIIPVADAANRVRWPRKRQRLPDGPGSGGPNVGPSAGTSSAQEPLYRSHTLREQLQQLQRTLDQITTDQPSLMDEVPPDH